MKLKQVLLIVLISSLSAFGSIWIYSSQFQKKNLATQAQGSIPANYAGFFDGLNNSTATPIDFTQAASTAVQGVVHIKTKIPAQKVSNDVPRQNRGRLDDWFDQFFDFGPQVIPEQRASGSGVLITGDGYIVTNNHVISDMKGQIAEEIMVTLHNKKTYKARVIGKDPSSDIAVLKIDGNNLPYLLYGNSDIVKLGQWVLAIGYPLTLETTVTAGIVSAKGRSIGINQRQISNNVSPVESFIQTDAAVNSGNSGGALVNIAGELIGINSAILAPNGTYAGYSFAIPVNLARKIVNDLIEFGDVKRGYLGISYPSQEIPDEQKKQLGLLDEDGVYVSDVSPDGAAKAAGIKKGDIITKVNNVSVSSGIEMSVQVAPFRPGDKVMVTYKRNSKEYTTNIILKERAGNFDIVNVNNVQDQLGAELTTLEAAKATQYNIEGGVVVKKIRDGGKLSETRMDDGFIITSVNGKDVKNVDELARVLSSIVGIARIQGIYPGSDPYVYPLDLRK